MNRDNTLKRSPYARILENAEKGMGVHLTWREVQDMSMDQSIRQRGELDLLGVVSEDDL